MTMKFGVRSLLTLLLAVASISAAFAVMLIYHSHHLPCTTGNCDTSDVGHLHKMKVKNSPSSFNDKQKHDTVNRPSSLKNHLESYGNDSNGILSKPGSEVEATVLNPGCKEKKRLKDYRVIDTGRVYNHPPIVHYVKLNRYAGKSSINFREYTSVLSVYKFLHPETIMFHTYSNKITGHYWDVINSWPDVKIKVNQMPVLDTLSGKLIPYIQHEADYIKLKSVYNYGGLVLDFDVIIVNGTRLKRQQRLSECVLSEEGDYINCGYYSCIKNSPYIAKWLDSYDTDYRPDLWLHNGSFRPKDFLLDTESSVCYNVHLDDTICIHPNWGMQREWLKKGQVQWRTKTAAHYFVKDNIPNDGEGLLKASHPLAKLIRYVHDA